MRSLPVIAIVLLALSRAVVAEKYPAKADIVLVLDSSYSVGYNNYQKELQFAVDLTENFTIGPNDVRFGAVIYAAEPQKLFDLKDNDSHESLKINLLNAIYLGSNLLRTDKALGLVLDSEMFSTWAGGRPDASDIVIIVTGGVSENTERTLKAASRLKARGVTIIAVGIGNVSQKEVRGMASSDQDVFIADNFDELSAIQQRVVERTWQAIGIGSDGPAPF